MLNTHILRISKLLSVLLTGLLLLRAAGALADEPGLLPPHAFFATLSELCGARYEGSMTYPKQGNDEFTGKLLVADIKRCSDELIEIPFAVGDDRSRTWLLRRTESGLQLKHDHRHADGHPHDITMYGGATETDGTTDTQVFPADDYTAELIPEASTNVWSISLSDDLSTLTYHLERHDKPRFTAILKRANLAEAD